MISHSTNAKIQQLQTIYEFLYKTTEEPINSEPYDLIKSQINSTKNL